ncbi:carbohydrate kinase family protein [Clostridium pasteurianum]|uniref:Sugar kinase, ribokinase n=1 Tax=Clostridium pasteurianum BC1 TaxID=86416 RepID=R4K6J7_CLOPA|nr:carbohydrate kinase [Clostridium pasteurianum]AGK98812.1 sugar kinase, ribokinase [Clostridium pasteurianum BC1]
MNNVLCIGELLIDFICSDVNTSLDLGDNFKKKAGGAPANVTAAICKLGGKASFVGKVGDDPFGKFLKDTLDNLNVDTSMLLMDKIEKTTLAFVSLKANGERDFVFNRGADGCLKYNELDLDKIYSNKVLHFGSATALLGGDMRESYVRIMQEAKRKNIFISFDPNFRDNLWEDNVEDFIHISKKCIEFADFIKVSDEELKIITGKEDLYAAVDSLRAGGNKIVAVTLGKDGTLISTDEKTEIIPSIKIKSIDSTGAGDAFVGSLLYKISLLEDSNELYKNFNELKDIVKFANKVGAIVCTKLGAIAALPTLEEVENM